MAGQATCKLRKLAQQNPAIETLVLVDVPGTVDLIDTQAATRFVRQKGWDTLVPRTGSIASGGVMLFLGGVNRVVEPGGQVGVPSALLMWFAVGVMPIEDVPPPCELVWLRPFLIDASPVPNGLPLPSRGPCTGPSSGPRQAVPN